MPCNATVPISPTINNKLGKRTRGHCVSIHHHHHHHQQRYMDMAWYGKGWGSPSRKARASICAHSPCPVCPGLSGFASLASLSMALSLHHGPLALLPPFFVSLVFALYLSSLRLFLSLCARPPRPMPSSQCSILAGHHGICRKSQIHGEADSRASLLVLSPQIEPCPGLAMPMPCEARQLN